MKTGYEFIDKVNNLVDLNNNESEPSVQDINLQELTIPELIIGSKNINNSAPCRIQEFNEIIDNFNKTSAIIESSLINTSNLPTAYHIKTEFIEDDENILFEKNFLEEPLTGQQTYNPVFTFMNQNCFKGGYCCIIVDLSNRTSNYFPFLELEIIDTVTQKVLKTFSTTTRIGDNGKIYYKFYYGSSYNDYNKNLTLKFIIKFYAGKNSFVNQITFQNRQFVKKSLEGLGNENE